MSSGLAKYGWSLFGEKNIHVSSSSLSAESALKYFNAVSDLSLNISDVGNSF
jgi:hypothetical protein